MLERPNEGSIAIGGQPLTGLGEAQLRAQRRRIGMVFQGFNLLSRRTVYGNVALPLEIAGVPKSEIPARVERLLALVGLEHLRDRYPSQISGGQKQRVGIARALANDPDVLLSDEATSALDPETTHNILALLRDINRKTGVTVVMITHQMEVVRGSATAWPCCRKAKWWRWAARAKCSRSRATKSPAPWCRRPPRPI